MSEPHTPTDRTSTITSPAPGAGAGNSSRRIVPGGCKTAARFGPGGLAGAALGVAAVGIGQLLFAFPSTIIQTVADKLRRAPAFVGASSRTNLTIHPATG